MILRVKLLTKNEILRVRRTKWPKPIGKHFLMTQTPAKKNLVHFYAIFVIITWYHFNIAKNHRKNAVFVMVEAFMSNFVMPSQEIWFHGKLWKYRSQSILRFRYHEIVRSKALDLYFSKIKNFTSFLNSLWFTLLLRTHQNPQKLLFWASPKNILPQC